MKKRPKVWSGAAKIPSVLGALYTLGIFAGESGKALLWLAAQTAQ